MVVVIFAAAAISSEATMNLRQGIGFLVVFTVYLLIGGAVFMVLEKSPIVTLSDTYTALRLFKDLLLLNDSLEMTGINQLEWINHVNYVFDNLSEIYLQQNSTMGQWNFYDSVFFCLTVITTIGYGNKYPTTESSRGFCIIYALIGIPLTGIWMAVIGNFFSKKLLKAHEKTRTSRSSSPRLALIINTITFLIPGFVVFLLMPAAVFMAVEEWTYLDGFYYAVVTLTTIGFGDLVAGQGKGPYNMGYLIGIMIWIIFGLGYLSMILNFIAKAMKSKHVMNIERTLTKNLKQTQDAFAKEVDYLIKTMNELIKGKHGEFPKLKRRSSCPSLEPSNEKPLKRSSSTGSLTAAVETEICRESVSQDNPANFIFDLAMAIACGDLNKGGDNRRPTIDLGSSDRSNNVAQLLTMALLPQLRAGADQTNGLKIPSPSSAKSTHPMFDFITNKSSGKPKVTKSNSVFGNFLFPFGLTTTTPPPSPTCTSATAAEEGLGSPPPRPCEPKPMEHKGSLFKNMMKRQLERSESSPLNRMNETLADKLSRRGSNKLNSKMSPLASPCPSASTSKDKVEKPQRKPTDESKLCVLMDKRNANQSRKSSAGSLNAIDEGSVAIDMPPTSPKDDYVKCEKSGDES